MLTLIFYLVTHYFLPRHSNNFKPKILHSQSIAFLMVGFLFMQLVLHLLPQTGLRILGYAANISPGEVIRLINEKRVATGLNPLSENPQLSQAALAKGTDMLNKDYWAHVAPDGTEPWAFLSTAGYTYRFAGENLARDFSNPGSAVDAWLASPSHTENILSEKYQETGVAVVEGDMAGVDTTIIVQFFAAKYVDTFPVKPVAAAVPLLPPTAVSSPTRAPSPTEPTPTSVQTAPIAQVGPEVTPLPQQASAGPLTLESFSKTNKILISPFSTTKGVSLTTISVLLMVLTIDGIIVARRKITRIGGRTLAHLSFLGMILAIIIIAKAGQIL